MIFESVELGSDASIAFTGRITLVSPIPYTLFLVVLFILTSLLLPGDMVNLLVIFMLVLSEKKRHSANVESEIQVNRGERPFRPAHLTFAAWF